MQWEQEYCVLRCDRAGLLLAMADPKADTVIWFACGLLQPALSL